jgi:hypothetical protein
VAKRLEPFIAIEFAGMKPNDREAAALAVSDVLNGIDLEAKVFEADLDAMQLENIARERARAIFASLDSQSRGLAEAILRESCNYIVALADELPNFNVAATREILKKHRELLPELLTKLDTLAQMRTESVPDRRRSPPRSRNMADAIWQGAARPN